MSGNAADSPKPEPRDDDEAEAARHTERGDGDDNANTNNNRKGKKNQRKKKNRGQNTGRKFERPQDGKALCQTAALSPEFSPKPCQFGDKCRFEHDLRKYLEEYKREDLKTFNGTCPVWEAYGECFSGWKCRFVGSHMAEREVGDRKELVLVEDEERKEASKSKVDGVVEGGVVGVLPADVKLTLAKKKYPMPKSDAYIQWITKTTKELEQNVHGRRLDEDEDEGDNGVAVDGKIMGQTKEEIEERRARYTEPPFLPSEKRRLYFGPETPVLAPLTTQGNMPFRRLCVELGAQFTYSEMAVSMPLIQGSRSEWALMKSHESEALPPTINMKQTVVQDYDNSRDSKVGAQIASNRPWSVTKATELLTSLCPHLRVVDLNCGCPIELVYREGSGSALLDHQAKLEKMLRGMNGVSGEVPVTAKIRTGTRDGAPNAMKLAERLILGGHEAHEMGQGPVGIGALTLHGRSRQQRYTRRADWEYISECSALIKRLNEKKDTIVDTIREGDDRQQPSAGRVFFLGNGDCYSHADYYSAIEKTGVDTVMIGRGALLKPWIFEEIQAGQYLDKSASERLSIMEKFAKYGLSYWGSDEHGVATTRRFLLEWLSFTYRYIPIGLLEYLPPNIQDRPPAWRGRSDLEDLLASDNFKDWIKIT